MLRVTDLTKEFRFYRRPWDRLVEGLSWGKVRRAEVFVALDRVAFEVSAGRSLGIIGANGAGKSTLLKIIAGTLYPTSGIVEAGGRVAALLELGTGFHPDFTGRQNIVFNARFLGLEDEEIEARMADVIAFAELGDFLDRPLRTYSSGMQMRLGFAVAANVSPEILIVDEALSVGDAYFQQKCIRRIREFREQGVTTLFVSHDPGAVKSLCDEAILLKDGCVIGRGRPDEVLEVYNALIARKSGEEEFFALEAARRPTEEKGHRSGSFQAVIAAIGLYDAQGRPARAVFPGEEVEIRVTVFFFAPLSRPTVGVLIRDRLGNDVYGTNTFHQEIDSGSYQAGETGTFSFFLRLDLGPGDYTLTAAVHTLDVHVHDCYDWVDRCLAFRVLRLSTRPFIGTAFLHPRVAVSPKGRTCQGPAGLLEDLFGPLTSSLSMHGGGLLSGWYPSESNGEETFRWTQRAFAFVLALAGERLCFEVGTDRPDNSPVKAEVFLGEQSLGGFAVDPKVPWSTFAVPLPPRHDRGIAYLSVQLSDTWCPKETGAGEDNRQLGLRVRRIWVE